MPPLSSAGLYLAGLLVGLGIVLQQVVNANLRSVIGSPYWAGLINFLIGSAALTIVVIVARAPMPTWDSVARAPWYAWLGGFLGAAYVVGAILLIPRLGAATVVALLIVGQLIGSLALDNFGALGLTVHEAGWPRLLGACLLIAGAALISAF